MRWPFRLLLATSALHAHVVSMSTGDLTIEGARAHYTLRMPMYEVAHVAAPERALLEHVRFANAKLVSATCAPDSTGGTYVCEAGYEFARPPEQVDVECTLAAITVPNHVHLLRAQLGQKHDQAVFDLTFTHQTLRFRPPTAFETAAGEAAAGFARALGGPVQILFLAALVLAARSRRELPALAAAFLAGQAASVWILPHTAWQPAPRFVEAAAALTVAYLAVEILLLPKAGARWLVAGVLGAFHGLYFELFVQGTGYRPGYVMAGAGMAELLAVAILAGIAVLIRRARVPRLVEIGAGGLLVFGMVWFAMRLRG